MNSRLKKIGYLVAASLTLLLLVVLFQYPWFSSSIDDWLANNLTSNPSEFPRSPDGRADMNEFYNSLSSKGVTPDNNFANDLIQIFGTYPFNQAELNRWLAPEKPFPTESRWIPSSEFSSPNDLLPSAGSVIEETEAQIAVAGGRPWTRSQLPLVAAWLDANETNLEQIQNAARKKPSFFFPLIAGENKSLVVAGIYPADKLVFVAQAFARRALNHMANGRYSEAADDIQTIRRLGTLIRKPNILITRLMGVSIDSISSSVEDILIAQKGVPTSILKRLQDIVRPTDQPENIGDVILNGERLFVLSPLQQTAKDSLAYNSTSTQSQFLFNRWTDRSFAAEMMDAKIKDLARRWNEPDDIKRLAQLGRWTASLHVPTPSHEYFLRLVSGSRSRGNLLANLMQETYFQDPVMLERAFQRAKAQRRISETAFAIRRFQLDNDRLPTDLKQLVPNYLDAVPIDCFTGQPLLFRVENDSFLLYSVGPNGLDQQTDANGALIPITQGSNGFDPQLDDIVIGHGN